MSLTATCCFSLRNALTLSLRMKSLRSLIRPNLQIGMKRWFRPISTFSKMDYEAAISYFIRLENLDKICRTNGPAPTVAVDNNTSFTSSVGNSNARKKQKTKMWCHYCDKTTTTRLIAEKLQRPNSTKRPSMGPRLFQGKRPYPFSLRRSTPLRNS